jgi:hypothetical protein
VSYEVSLGPEVVKAKCIVHIRDSLG